MPCCLCGDQDTIYVCKNHARFMLTKKELRDIYLYASSIEAKYKDENGELLYLYEDVRDKTPSLPHFKKFKKETQDSFIRLRNLSDVAYKRKMIKEKKKVAIENFVYVAMKKINKQYIDAFQPQLEQTIENHINSKYKMTPAEIGLSIYKDYEYFVHTQEEKKVRKELAEDFLKLQTEQVQNVFKIGGITYEKFVNGNLQFDEFTKEITDYISRTCRRDILHEKIIKHIPEKYRLQCESTSIAHTFIQSGNIGNIDKIITFFKQMVEQSEIKKLKSIRNSSKFFDSF